MQYYYCYDSKYELYCDMPVPDFLHINYCSVRHVAIIRHYFLITAFRYRVQAVLEKLLLHNIE